MILSALLLAVATRTDSIAGRWEGSSLCQVRPSPCHDERVVYRVDGGGRDYKFDAYKVVNGKELFMGAIDMTLSGSDLDGRVISSGQTRARLHFSIKGSHLSGRMTLTDGTLYRLIEADKR